MKKLITSLFVLMAIVFSAHGQVYGSYNQYKYKSNTSLLINQDTAYVMLQCRAAQWQAMCSSSPGVLKAVAGPAAYNAGDSVTWRVIKGAYIGTIPTIRYMNVRTGEFLYQGLNGGTVVVPYVAPMVDPNNGTKDFSLVEQGVESGKDFFDYFIEDMANSGLQFINATVGSIGVKAASAAVGWRTYLKQGPQPKAVRFAPTVTITTNDVVNMVGGSINLEVQVTKGASDLTGTTKLFHNAVLLTTLALDATGHATYNYPGLIDGVENFTAVYSGDSYYDPENALLSILPVPNPAALSTKVLLNMPVTSEFSKDAKLNITVQTGAGDPVGQGRVYVYVNGLVKNNITVDALGTGSVTFNNLLTGTNKIKAYYFGDKMAYLNSDTTRVSIDITPTTSSVKPYPVYFDLTCQPVINKWRTLYAIDPLKSYYHGFPQDSIPEITTDSIKGLIGFSSVMVTPLPAKIDDYNFHFNFIEVPLGSSRGSWVNFKTPWLNEGSYNVWVNGRVSSPTINMTDIKLDGKSGYYPNEDMPARFLKAYGGQLRRWNAGTTSNNIAMRYLGTVNATSSDIHDLKIYVEKTSGAAVGFNLMEFIPVEMDSLTINNTAAVNLAKVYYPMFDIGGFARMPGDAAVQAYTDYTTLAIPYQVTDQTLYSKTTHVIDTLGNARTTFAYTDYVIVYRKDKWTRMSEGPVDLNTLTYTCDLPNGDYYYQELDFYPSDVVQGTGRRRIIKDGTFTVIGQTAVNSPITSNIKAYGNNKTLTVKGIKAGAKILITDLSGKILVNEVATSDVFTKALNTSIYILKVVSENDILRTKVLVK